MTLLAHQLHGDRRGERRDDREVQRAFRGGRRERDERFEPDEKRRRDECDHDREDDDVDRLRAADDEELGRPPEQVEERLGDRERPEHQQVQELPRELPPHVRGCARYRTRVPPASSSARATSKRSAISRSNSARV